MIEPATQALIDALYAQHTETGDSAAKLIEWFLDERPTWAQALAEERADNARLRANVDEMAARLNRLGDHLQTLADYAEATDHDELDNPPLDPFPEAK